MVGLNYTTDLGGVWSDRSCESLIGIEWRYVQSGLREVDETLKVEGSIFNSMQLLILVHDLEGEPYYPDTVTVFSNGAAPERTDDMGLYKRMMGVYQRGRPVYKQENGVRYIYCNSKYSFYFSSLLTSSCSSQIRINGWSGMTTMRTWVE